MVPSHKKDACPWAVAHCHDQAIPWRTRTLRTAEEIVPVIEGLLGNLQSAGYCEKETFAVRLALEEALVNAIKHGHQSDPSKEVQLRYHHTPECLLIEIEDQGPGFKPEGVPDPFTPENLERPCGRGLLLMQRYMTWVRFNDAGNRVTMCRHRISA
ncbi:MAG TPA: ATP-binding protein [Gemmataceae bacterium]|nr:ATP-binding protein [Gemmataceae bacterium]